MIRALKKSDGGATRISGGPDGCGWTSRDIRLSGDIVIRATLPKKGRLVIRAQEKGMKCWPVAYISPCEKDFEIKLWGVTRCRYIRIFLTEEPKKLEYANI